MPVGVTQASLVAIVQYSNLIEPSGVPSVGIVNVNLWFTLPPGIEPPTPVTPTSVKLRAVICAADASGPLKTAVTLTATNNTLKKYATPLTLLI